MSADQVDQPSADNAAAGSASAARRRTAVRRLPEKAVTDVDALYAVLDAALVAHVAVVDDGQPFVIPMACARDGDRLLLHGSTASRLTRALAAGAPTCATVTLLDGLVYARSAFESSMNYRSALVLGVASRVPENDMDRSLKTLTDHLMPGRFADVRASTRKELVATLLLSLPLDEWSVKISDGPPEDPEEDLSAPIWAGVLPLALAAGEPVDAPDLVGDQPPPPYAGAGYRRLATQDRESEG